VFGIFDLAFPKMWTQLLLSGNLSYSRKILLRVAWVLSFSRVILSPIAANSLARRTAAFIPQVHDRLVQVIEIRSRQQSQVALRHPGPKASARRASRSPKEVAAWSRPTTSARGSLASLQEKEAAMDLLRPRAKKGGGARRKEAARGGKKRVARGKESSRGKLPRRGEYGHDKESKILGISKLPSHCAYAKMPSLVHQMPSLPKCISPMQNCWRAILRFLANFKNAKSNCITVGDALTEQS